MSANVLQLLPTTIGVVEVGTDLSSYGKVANTLVVTADATIFTTLTAGDVGGIVGKSLPKGAEITSKTGITEAVVSGGSAIAYGA